MSERYWITGAEIGAIKALIETKEFDKADDLLNEIIANQFIGNMPEPYENYEIVIDEK